MDTFGSKLLQKVPLAYKYHSLSKALSNEEASVPGYICEEICSRTFESSNVSRDVLDFLLFSLESNSAKEKLKTLKVIRYLVVNGETHFRHGLRKRDRSIKEATNFNEESDPMCGNSLSLAIRNEAKEVLRLLFEGFSDLEPSHTNRYNEKGFSAMGMGSQAQTGKYEGFGNSPMVSNKTVLDKVVSGLTDIADKILNVPDERDMITNALKSDSGNYHAVSIALEHPSSSWNSDLRLKKPVKQIPMTAAHSGHIPGKAGGGWGNEEEEEELENDTKTSPTEKTQVDTSSSGNDWLKTNQRSDTEMMTEDNYLEEQFLAEILSPEKEFTSWQHLDGTCRRCATLNCDRVLRLLQESLSQDDDFIKKQILIFLEALLYQDIVQVETLMSMFDTDLNRLALDGSKPYSIKSKKLLLIFNKLHSLQSGKQA